MSYSIIGSGAIGSALAGHFASKGIEVLLANSRGPASLKDIVGKLGSKVQAATAKEAANANIVILAVPFPSVADAVGGISDWRGRIVVDANRQGHNFSYKQVPKESFAGFFPGAAEIAEMLSYWEAHTYLGSDSPDQIVALANKIAGREPTRFSTWARENFPIPLNATDGALH